MKKTIKVEVKRPMLSYITDIVYSTVKDMENRPIELKLAIMTEGMPDFSGSGERIGRDVYFNFGVHYPTMERIKRPVVMWINGGGWTGMPASIQINDLGFLAEAGYAVACVYYRGSGEGKLPAQIEDVKTAIRFLRANAERYSLDPDKIAVMGRSGGGQLSAMAGLNDGRFITGEYPGVSADVQAVVDMFGPVQLYEHTLSDMELEKQGLPITCMGKTVAEGFTGRALGGDPATMAERVKAYDVVMHVNGSMAPFLILHGDCDRLVSCRYSEALYEAMLAAGEKNEAELYIVEGAGHGSPEFFEEPVQKMITAFLNRHLK